MNKKYKIAFATGSRADYGIVRNYIAKLNEDPCIDFSILATGALTSDKFGKAIDLIRQDGFKIDFEHQIEQNVSDTSATVIIMAQTLKDFSDFFAANSYDLLIILGDRYEIYSVAIAAAMHRLPIIHLHGGEITLANYDEFIRHSITKMANFHITSTEEYRHRVIQLGEDPEKVFNLGALGAENCHYIDMANVPEELENMTNVFTVLFHPETLNSTPPARQVEELLEAIRPFVNGYNFVFIGSNADTHSDQISNRIQKFCKEHPSCLFYSNLHPDAYHYLVKNSYALIGNSSSGIIEVPSLGSYTINIGDRQTGRAKGKSIFDVRCEADKISGAIEYVLETKDNPIADDIYYRHNSAQLYYEVTKEILKKLPALGFKEFHDIQF
ncbi:MAG: UDP-N-acetylglucosamine 2-epimerase [Muribaculum sp.]|nr:UDP-N-acetylglucosamine 2-epimerase [Muribaculum sp.]